MDKTPYTDIIELVLALMKSYELDSIYDDAIQNSEDKDDSSGDKAMFSYLISNMRLENCKLQGHQLTQQEMMKRCLSLLF